MINLPFSVYTAWHGYAWSSVPDGVSQEELDALYRKVGEHRPDFMGPEDCFEGVFCNNGLVAAFKMRCVPKWDSVGRDADYCAFTFMGPEDAGDFDFDVLFGLEAFAKPVRKPLDYMLYDGAASSPYSHSFGLELRELGEAGPVDFHSVGDLLSKCSGYCSEWLFCRTLFQGARRSFAKTGAWTGEPPEWASERMRKKSSFQKISLEELGIMCGGSK